MKWWVFIAGFIAALVLALSYFLIQKTSSSVSAVHQLTLQQPCDLHLAPCVAADATGRVIRLQLLPADIPLMKELTVQVDLEGIHQYQTARVTVEGTNMFMGYQQAELLANTASRLTGTLVLPVCTLEKMAWQATVDLATPSGKIQAIFPFTTQR